MTRRTAAGITDDVLASFAACPNPRLQELMRALVKHLHEFVREVGLTTDEWAEAMKTLADTGKITTDARQEFILWSDALGLSTLVDQFADNRSEAATESTVQGPFWVQGSKERPYGASISERPGGTPLWIHGRVLDSVGHAIVDAELDVWQNGPNMLYAVQDPSAPEHHLRGRFRTLDDGSYGLLAIRPTPYPIPDDGPVGAMLEATGRHPWRPAHIHVAVSAPGHLPVVTHIFDADSEYLDSDAVFAVKPNLIKPLEPREASHTPRPAGIDGSWVSLEVDFTLDKVLTENV